MSKTPEEQRAEVDACLQRLVQNQKDANTWFDLSEILIESEYEIDFSTITNASSLALTETGDRFRQAVQCLVRGLTYYPYDAKAWFALSYLLSQFKISLSAANASSLRLTGNNFHQAAQCLTRGLIYCPDDADAWFNLGLLLKDQAIDLSKIGKIPGEALTGNQYQQVAQCFMRGLTCYPYDADAWFELGLLLKNHNNIHLSFKKDKIFGRILNGNQSEQAVQCFMQGLAYDLKNKNMRSELYSLLNTDTDKATDEQAAQYFAKTLTYDKNNAAAWFNLGFLLINPSNVDLSTIPNSSSLALIDDPLERPAQCIAKGLEIDPHNANAWFELGLLIRYRVLSSLPNIDGDRYQQAAQCMVRALVCDEHNSEAWFNLGGLLRYHSTIDLSKIDKVPGEALTGDRYQHAAQCMVRALVYDEHNSDAWFNLGGLLKYHDTIDLSKIGKVPGEVLTGDRIAMANICFGKIRFKKESAAASSSSFASNPYMGSGIGTNHVSQKHGRFEEPGNKLEGPEKKFKK